MTLKATFTILTICGCWIPPSWSKSFYKRLLYNLYTIFIIVFMGTAYIFEAIGVSLKIDNTNDVSDDIYILLEEILSCCKMLSLVINSKDIAKLMDTLTREPLRPLDEEEQKIKMTFDKVVWYKMRSYLYLVETTLTFFIFLSLVMDLSKRQLVFDTWLPFDSTPSYIFYVTYAHQILALVIGAHLHLGLDTLICSFLIQICCQMKILENRFTKITNERKASVKLCVRHHQSIYKFAATINDMFYIIIFVQFFVSTSIVCFTLYQLNKMSGNSSAFIKTSLYMATMLSQVFLYCWYGNQVTLKSQDIANQIFAINWPDLDIDVRKNLLLIMNRSVMPITIISLNILPMNLQSFVSILKTSYSAYNILQQTQE